MTTATRNTENFSQHVSSIEQYSIVTLDTDGNVFARTGGHDWTTYAIAARTLEANRDLFYTHLLPGFTVRIQREVMVTTTTTELLEVEPTVAS